MKQVLFRGRRIKDNRWVFGDLIHEDEKAFIRRKSKSESKYINEEVNPQTVTQFIGVCDALYRPVFEGDILRHVSEPDCEYYKYDAIVAYDPDGIGYIGYRTAHPFSLIGDPDTLSCFFYQEWDKDKKCFYFPNAVAILDIWDIPVPDTFESTCLMVDTFDKFLEHFQ